jgi:hypothetical protein
MENDILAIFQAGVERGRAEAARAILGDLKRVMDEDEKNPGKAQELLRVFIDKAPNTIFDNISSSEGLLLGIIGKPVSKTQFSKRVIRAIIALMGGDKGEL